MPDIPFTLESLVRSLPQRAASRAVYGSICPEWLFQSGDLEAMHQFTMSAWRQRLDEAYQASWLKLQQSPQGYQYARNCPPFAVPQPSRTYRCRMSHFCPQCWGTDISMPLASRVQRLVSSSPGPLEWRLLDFRWQRHYSRSQQGQIPKAVGNFWRSDKKAEKQLRQQTLSVVPYVGAFLLHTITYLDRTICYTHRGLFVTLGREWPKTVPEGWRVHSSAARDCDIENVVGRVTRYPQRLLHCEPQEFINTYTCTQRKRLHEYYGHLIQRPGAVFSSGFTEEG